MNVPVFAFDEHTIKLDQHGQFWYGPQLVEHPGIERMLRIGLKRLPNDRYGYIMGPRSVEIVVEDVPFQVLGIHEEADGLGLSLSDETYELLKPESLIYKEEIPYCTLKRGDKARFTPVGALSLGHFLDFEDDKVFLSVKSERYLVPGAKV